MENFFSKLTNGVKYILKGSNNRTYPDSYIEELEYQCSRLLPLCTCGIFMWLPYYLIDQTNYPVQTGMPLIRLGLTFISILILFSLIFIQKPWKYWHISMAVIWMGYVVFGAGAVALLSGGDPAYFGGFYLCLMLCSLMGPIPFNVLAIMLTAAYSLFAAGVFLLKVDLSSNSQQYSLRDLMTVILITYLLGFVQHRIRKSHYLRAKEIERQKALIEIKEAESNQLLLNILPESVATELKAKGHTQPVRITDATVMFTDFVGFTRISENLPAEAVVDELDKCFSYFDQVTEKYNLEKLKTIGDSFMCAGGIPEANKTHVLDCCLAALEIQAFMNQMREIKIAQGYDYWELRLGINSGPLVAGVVGHKKFAYDVWGDTVNTASRLESSGIPGKINVSKSSYKIAKRLFDCEHRGKVKAKGKGDIDMYFLHGIRRKFSVNGEGRVPNNLFKEAYEQIAAKK